MGLETPTDTGKLTATDGVFSNIADPLRPSTALKVGNNINQFPRNVFTNRISGWTKQREAEFNSGAEIMGFGKYTTLEGVEFLLVQFGDTLYQYDIDTKVEDPIKTGLSELTDLPRKAIPSMCMFSPYEDSEPFMVYVNGKDAPQKITYPAGVWTAADLQLNGADFGTTPLDPAVSGKTPANPTFACPFLDRMAFTGFTGNASFDVLFTNAGSAETCEVNSPIQETDGGMFQLDPSLGRPTALKAFKLSNSNNEQILLIGQERGVSIITGTGASSFQCFTLTDEYGIPSNNTFIQIGSNLWFLANDGVRQFSALAENANLVSAALTYPVQDLAYRFNETQLYKAHAVHHKKYMEVQFWYPIDSDDVPQNAFTLSYINTPPGESGLSTQIFTKDGTECLASIYYKKKFYGGTSTGILQEHHSGNLYDTSPVESTITLAQILSPGPKIEIGHLEGVVITYGGNQKFIINANYLAMVIYDQGRTLERSDAEPSDILIQSGATGGTVLDEWSLENDAFPSEHMRFHDFWPIAWGYALEITMKCNASDHILDFFALDYTVQIGKKNA